MNNVIKNIDDMNTPKEYTAWQIIKKIIFKHRKHYTLNNILIAFSSLAALALIFSNYFPYLYERGKFEKLSINTNLILNISFSWNHILFYFSLAILLLFTLLNIKWFINVKEERKYSIIALLFFIILQTITTLKEVNIKVILLSIFGVLIINLLLYFFLDFITKRETKKGLNKYESVFQFVVENIFVFMFLFIIGSVIIYAYARIDDYNPIYKVNINSEYKYIIQSNNSQSIICNYDYNKNRINCDEYLKIINNNEYIFEKVKAL